MRTSSTISFFEQDKSKNQTRPHRNHHRDNIAMLVSYVKATPFINSVPILSLVAAIIFSQLGKQWLIMDPFGHPDF